MACCGAFLSALVRLFALFVALFGGGLVAYGIFFAVRSGGGALLPILVSVVLGVLDLLMGFIIMTCGYRSLCALRAFLLINGLLLLGELVIAILFAVPSTQSKIIDDMELQADVLSWVQANIAITTYVLLGAIGVKAVAVFFVATQSCAVNRGFDESEYGELPAISMATASRRAGGETLLAAEESSAAARYKERNASLYGKYGVSDGFRK